MAVALTLVHSPLVGPATWDVLAAALSGRGREAWIPDLTRSVSDGPPYLAVQVESIVEVVDGRPTILVGRSGAGPLLAAMGQSLGCVEGYVFVDAGLPHPGLSWFDSAPPELAELRDAPGARWRQQVPSTIVRGDSPCAHPVVSVPLQQWQPRPGRRWHQPRRWCPGLPTRGYRDSHRPTLPTSPAVPGRWRYRYGARPPSPGRRDPQPPATWPDSWASRLPIRTSASHRAPDVGRRSGHGKTSPPVEVGARRSTRSSTPCVCVDNACASLSRRRVRHHCERPETRHRGQSPNDGGEPSRARTHRPR